MSQLTQEAFQAALRKLATKDDLEGLATKDDLKTLVTKAELQDLRTHIDASSIGVKNDISGLRAEMNLRFDAMLELLDMRKRVETLERQVAELLAK